MPLFFRPHISLSGRTQILPYTSNQSGRSPVLPRSGLNRRSHARTVREKLRQAVADFQSGQDLDFVYVTFISPPNFLLDIDKFTDTARDLRLASYREVPV